MSNDNDNQVELATDIASAWLSNPNTRAAVDDIPAFLASVYGALGNLATPAAGDTVATGDAGAEHKPAVGVRKSLADPNFIISLLDGKPYRTLKRHLSSHGLTMDEYRERFGLKADYPSVAPAYSAARSATAKRLGLGRKPGQKEEQKPVEEAPAPKARKGKGIAAAKAAAKAHLGGGGGS